MSRSIFTIVLILLIFGGVTAGTIKVPTDYATIQAGINAAFPGDTVLVSDGTYFENIDFKGKAITVASYYLFDGDTTHVDSTIIDGSQPSDPGIGSVVSFFSEEDTTSVLYGFTITGGSGTLVGSRSFRAGGGIISYNSGCKIVANKIINNSVTCPYAYGGGLAALPPGSNAYVVLKDNQITYNTVTADSIAIGGGVWLYCSAKITGNLISHNTCTANVSSTLALAGGIGCYADPPFSLEIIMEKNTITHNSLRNYGNLSNSSSAFTAGAYLKGANGRMTKNEISFNEVWDFSNKGSKAIGALVVQSPDSFVIEGNTIRENAVKQGTGICYGGGLEVFGTGIVSVMNNIIEGNIATYGGGMRIDNTSTVKIVNNTIINNKSTYGGGISVHDATGYVMNCIVWGNQATTHPGIHVESGSIQVAYSDVQGGWSGTGNITADPLFADTLFHLSESSPCINAGIASFDFGGGMVCYCPEKDIVGNSRPYPSGGNPDMGAYEPVITEVMNSFQTEIPQSYFLAQNYPNPFNPATTIEFALPKSAFVTLKVYNLLGEQVATLIAEQRTAGIHKISWNASGLASGVYLYRLEAGEFEQARKLILLR